MKVAKSYEPLDDFLFVMFETVLRNSSPSAHNLLTRAVGLCPPGPLFESQRPPSA